MTRRDFLLPVLAATLIGATVGAIWGAVRAPIDTGGRWTE